MSLSGAGGWAQRLINVRRTRPSASAFIGTYWFVDDDKAFGFAKEFYDQLLGGRKTIGEVVREARLVIQKRDDARSVQKFERSLQQ